MAALALLAAGCMPPVEGEDPQGCEPECIQGFEEKTCDEACMAVTQCRALVDAVCERYSASCPFMPRDECSHEVGQNLRCENVSAIGETYEECIEDLDGPASCENPPRFPPSLFESCSGVLLQEDGEAETCEEMAERWACFFDSTTPSCVDENEPSAFPLCVCDDGFDQPSVYSECVETCENKPQDLDCGPFATVGCPQDFGEPRCLCTDGYERERDMGPCLEMCGHKAEALANDCGENVPNSHLRCLDPGSTTEEPSCLCDEGYAAAYDSGNLICISELAPCAEVAMFQCLLPTGEPDPNCSCSCIDPQDPLEDPDCRCDPGYRSDGDSCVAE